MQWGAEWEDILPNENISFVESIVSKRMMISLWLRCKDCFVSEAGMYERKKDTEVIWFGLAYVKDFTKQRHLSKIHSCTSNN